MFPAASALPSHCRVHSSLISLTLLHFFEIERGEEEAEETTTLTLVHHVRSREPVPASSASLEGPGYCVESFNRESNIVVSSSIDCSVAIVEAKFFFQSSVEAATMESIDATHGYGVSSHGEIVLPILLCNFFVVKEHLFLKQAF